MAELSEFLGRVAEWHAAAFPEPSRPATAMKVFEEAAELHSAVRYTNFDGTVMREACDVVLAGLTMAVQVGTSAEIEETLNAKLQLLRFRAEQQALRDQARGIQS